MAITEARLGDEAQIATPADLRLGLNLSDFRSGLRHVVGSALIGLTSAAATVGLLWVSWETGQNEAAFFAGFTAVNTYWMIAYCRAAGDTLFNRYKNAISRADEANRENERLFRQNLRILTNLARREEGEAGDGMGDEVTSPASRFRVIHKGEIH